MATAKVKPSRFFVNNLTGVCEMHVTGTLAGCRLDKKVRAIFAALPAGSYVPAPRALWELYVDCYARKDAYKVRFVVNDARAVENALYALCRPAPKVAPAAV